MMKWPFFHQLRVAKEHYMPLTHSTAVKISIQNQDFNLQDEVNLLEQDNAVDGAVVTFTGRVRNKNAG